MKRISLALTITLLFPITGYSETVENYFKDTMSFEVPSNQSVESFDDIFFCGMEVLSRFDDKKLAKAYKEGKGIEIDELSRVIGIILDRSCDKLLVNQSHIRYFKIFKPELLNAFFHDILKIK